MPIPGRMPTKDMCARALASLRLSALPSCRAPLSPLGSRASRLCGQRLRAGRGCSPPPRHVADGHPACHRARPRRTGGRDLAQAGCVHGGRCESGLEQSSKGPVSQAGRTGRPPDGWATCAQRRTPLSPSGPSRPRRDGDHRRRQAVGHPERQGAGRRRRVHRAAQAAGRRRDGALGS